MATNPVQFDMTKAAPLEDAEAQPQPKFDMSQSTPLGQEESQGVVQPGDTNDPLAGHKDRPSTFGELGQAALEMGKGALKEAGQGAATVLHKLATPIASALGGDVSKGEESYRKVQELLHPSNAEQRAGAVGEGIGEFFLGDVALKGLSVAERLKLATKVAQLAEESPLAAKIIEIGMNAMRHGAVGTAQGLAHGQTVKDALKTGAITAGTSAAIGAVSHVLSPNEGLPTNPSIRPGNMDVAGEPVPVSAPQVPGNPGAAVEKPAAIPRAASALGTESGAQKMIDNYTQPAAVRATAKNLEKVAVETVDPLRIVRNEPPLAQNPPSLQTVDEAAGLMKKESQKTYQVLDSAVAEDLEQWKADKVEWETNNPAPQPRPKASPSTAQSTPGSRQYDAQAFKSDKDAWKSQKEAWDEANPEPKTFTQLQTQLIEAKRTIHSHASTPVEKQAAVEAMPGFEAQMEAFLKKHGDLVGPDELEKANAVYAKYMQTNWLADRIRTATRGTDDASSPLRRVPSSINVGSLEAIPAAMDNHWVAGTFEKLMGPEGLTNYKNVINALKNPLKGQPPLLDFLGKFGGPIRTPINWFFNKLLFDPEYGKWALTAWRSSAKIGASVVSSELSTPDVQDTPIAPKATHRFDPASGKVVPNE